MFRGFGGKFDNQTPFYVYFPPNNFERTQLDTSDVQDETARVFWQFGNPLQGSTGFIRAHRRPW
jgi:hypothetical protein